jgi:hypothetical protein
MSKPSAKPADKETQLEYDFFVGVRGKHLRRFQRGTNVVVLETDMAKFFSTPKPRTTHCVRWRESSAAKRSEQNKSADYLQ